MKTLYAAIAACLVASCSNPQRMPEKNADTPNHTPVVSEDPAQPQQAIEEADSPPPATYAEVEQDVAAFIARVEATPAPIRRSLRACKIASMDMVHSIVEDGEPAEFIEERPDGLLLRSLNGKYALCNIMTDSITYTRMISGQPTGTSVSFPIEMLPNNIMRITWSGPNNGRRTLFDIGRGGDIGLAPNQNVPMEEYVERRYEQCSRIPTCKIDEL